MIIPKFWAEARYRKKIDGRQVTLRRFGWSNASQAAAQEHAEARVQEAFAALLRGKPVDRRELKRAYNGSEGVPIREEIVDELGTTVITRNSYGSLCLNTPDALFVDIDFHHQPSCGLVSVMVIVVTGGLVATGWQFHWGGIIALGIAGMGLGYIAAVWLQRIYVALQGGVEQMGVRQIKRFVAWHPHWHVRIYRTPAGLRVLAMHTTFDPLAPEVNECFLALGADPIYVRMCQRQRCFRARVSPKPWRVGIRQHVKPRGVWPVDPARLPERQAWVRMYEQAASGFASCRFLEALGNGQVHPAVAEVHQLHDRLCRATSELPLA